MQMKYICIALTLFTLSAKAQIDIASRFSGMAYTGAALQDVWSIQQNQAGLCGIKKPTFSMGYAPKFLDNDLRTQAFVFAFPYRDQVFGLSLQRYGIDAYNEHKVGLAYARHFGDLFVAVHGNYHQLSIQHYGSAKSLSIETGFQYQVNQALCLGIHIANPSQNAYGTNQIAYIPTRTQVGGSFKFSNELLFAVSVEKAIRYPIDIRSGLEYKPIPSIALRGGMSLKPLKQYVGIGIHSGRFRFDLASSSHSTLGYAPQLAVSYEL